MWTEVATAAVNVLASWLPEVITDFIIAWVLRKWDEGGER